MSSDALHSHLDEYEPLTSKLYVLFVVLQALDKGSFMKDRTKRALTICEYMVLYQGPYIHILLLPFTLA